MTSLFPIQKRFLILSLVALCSIAACDRNGSSTSAEEEEEDSSVELVTDLIFNNITLEQSDDQGSLRWRMIAEQAIYSQDRRDAEIEKPSGQFFQNDEPAFSVIADQGEVRQDGNRLVLQGNVVITDENTGATIKGDRMRWIPEDNTIILRNNIVADHPDFKLTAQEIAVWVDEDRVEIKGDVKAETTDGTLQLNGEEVVWFLEEERIISDRPMRFQQRQEEEVTARAQGNKVDYDIKNQVANLNEDAVVVLQDPPIRVTGDALQFNQAENMVFASKRFTVFHRAEKINMIANEGQGNLDNQVFKMKGNVIVTAKRNQARLRSDRLTWTVPTQAIVAEGNVIYRQTDPVFNLKGPRAVGKLEDETIVVSGGRVITEIIPDS
ncbi:MAG: LPS export ABC transporter periplasmic protein LptC [Cyanobacteria bacterium P01_F01_bin.150]